MVQVKLSLSQQLWCAKSKNPAIRLAISSYPVFPEVVDYMVEHETNKHVIGKIFSNLFRIPNSNISSSTLLKAAMEKVSIAGVSRGIDSALVHIALHLNTDVYTLECLFALDNPCINWGLACNPNTPKTILDKLSDLEDFSIDDALINNPNTAEETKQKIWPRYKYQSFSSGYHYDLLGINVVASGN